MSGTIGFRPMTAPDIDAVHRIELDSAVDPWSRSLLAAELDGDRADRHWLVADAGEAAGVVAFGGVLFVLDEVHVMNLAVAPDHRRRGLASALLAGLLGHSAQRGAAGATLEVRASNRPAIGLYRRFGFQVAGHRPAYYPDGEDAAIMWLHGLDTGDVQDRLAAVDSPC